MCLAGTPRHLRVQEELNWAGVVTEEKVHVSVYVYAYVCVFVCMSRCETRSVNPLCYPKNIFEYTLKEYHHVVYFLSRRVHIDTNEEVDLHQLLTRWEPEVRFRIADHQVPLSLSPSFRLIPMKSRVIGRSSRLSCCSVPGA